MEYTDFLLQKSQCNSEYGFKPTFLPDFLFDFQIAMDIETEITPFL